MSKKQTFHPEQTDKDFVIGAYSDTIEMTDGFMPADRALLISQPAHLFH
jgi:hypothetical protein